MHRLLFAALLSSLFACRPTLTQGLALTALTEVASSAKCPAGGVRIKTGRDWNTDGVLSDDELIATSEVCNGVTPVNGVDGKDGRDGAAGANGVNGRDGVDGASGVNGQNGVDGHDGVNGTDARTLLSITTMLKAGDANCPSGGVRIESGLDDGPVNGSLDPAEIQSTRYVCNGTLPLYVGSTAAPAGPVGANAIEAIGGSLGGNGGTIRVALKSGTLGGNVKVFATGSLDAGVDWPITAFEPGPRPVSFTSDATLAAYPNVPNGLASGDGAFVVTGVPSVYRRVSPMAADEATSLTIAASVTLTVNVGIVIYVPNGVQNLGTLRGAAPSSGRPALLVVGSYFGAAGSALGSSGAEVTFLGSRFINEGAIALRGASGSAGENGGRFSVHTHEYWNRGLLDVRGGDSSGAVGGEGGQVFISSTVFGHSGTLRFSGGTGTTGGGAGGTVSVSTSGRTMRSKQSMEGLGGACVQPACVPGRGGAFWLTAMGSEVFWSSAIDVSGGAGNGSFNGGSGGTVSFSSIADRGLVARSIHLSASLTVNAGASTCGAGGLVEIALDPKELPAGQEIELLGYVGLSASGGHTSADGAGGVGGIIELLTAPSVRYDAWPLGPTGAVVNSSTLSARGGRGITGGSGGNLRLGIFQESLFGGSTEYVRNSGRLDASGAGGVSLGGSGGKVELRSDGFIENGGPVSLSGGDASGRGSSAGRGGTFDIKADSYVTQSAPVWLNGGEGLRAGGHAGSFDWSGSKITLTSTVSGGGGDGTDRGGDGMTADFTSLYEVSVFPAAAVDLRGGTGAVAGKRGAVVVDQVTVYR